MDEKDENGEFFSDYVRKLTEPGMAYCVSCKDRIKYASNGKKSFFGHAKKSAHVKARRALKETQSLPTIMMATKALETCEQPQLKQPELPYGAPPPIISFFKKAADKVAPPPPPPKPEPVAVSLADRKSHLEALLCSFIVEHDLSLSLAPELVSLAQELSKDP